ncbi:MAG: Gfo/Idh/MocA family oxidoreductase [Acidobacteria bacterium]|nr:Gfo/Idh/MocA family oxidoreductase [Acidobacteriota bacterium]
MRKLRFGLIGYGAWGKCHARAIQETAGCELRAVSAASDTSVAAAASETGAAVFRDFRELLASSEVDVVDIVVPNYLHEEIACASLESGRHVLLEKPMSTSIASCDRIIESARRSGCLLLVGHEMRFSAMYRQMREIIDSGGLGRPRYVLIDLWRRPYRLGSDGWRFDSRRVGNWTLEEPVHFFDAAAWFLDSSGEPAAVYARGNRSDPLGAYHPEMNDNFTAVVSYRDGAYAVISQSLAAVEHHLSIKVFGSGAMLRAEWHAELDRSERPSYSLQTSDGSGLKDLEVAATPGELFELREEIAAFADAVRNGRGLPITPEEARRAVVLCLEAQRSLTTGAAVPLTAAIPTAGS